MYLVSATAPSSEGGFAGFRCEQGPRGTALPGGAEVRVLKAAPLQLFQVCLKAGKFVGMGEKKKKKKGGKKSNKMQMCSWEDRQREHLDGSH